jgi:hypothetical protein
MPTDLAFFTIICLCNVEYFSKTAICGVQEEVLGEFTCKVSVMGSCQTL